MAIGAVGGALAVGLLLSYYCLEPGAPSSDGAAVAPPDRPEMESSPNLNSVPDLISSIVQSVHLIEAPWDLRGLASDLIGSLSPLQ